VKICKALEPEPADALTSTPPADLPERVSTAPPFDIGTGMGYRGYTYAVAQIRLSKDAPTGPSCFDSRCSASLIDRNFFKSQEPTAEIRTMAHTLRVKGISGNEHSSSKYVIAIIRIPGREYRTSRAVEALLTRELHIVDGLDANMLGIIVPEDMDLSIDSKTLRIGSCKVNADIQVHVRGSHHRHEHPVHAKSTTWIPPRSVATIPIHSLGVVADRDFLFEPVELEQLSLFAHVVNAKTASILVKNDTDRSIILP